MNVRRALGFLVCALMPIVACAPEPASPTQPEVPGGTDTSPGESGPAPTLDHEERRFLAEIDRSRGYRDCFPAIRDPEFTTVDGPHGLTDDEIVLGVDTGVSRFAYPVNVLNHHEIVEHDDGPLPLLVCW